MKTARREYEQEPLPTMPSCHPLDNDDALFRMVYINRKGQRFEGFVLNAFEALGTLRHYNVEAKGKGYRAVAEPVVIVPAPAKKRRESLALLAQYA